MIKQLLQSQLQNTRLDPEIQLEIHRKLTKVENITYFHFTAQQPEILGTLAKNATQDEQRRKDLQLVTLQRVNNIIFDIEKGELELGSKTDQPQAANQMNKTERTNKVPQIKQKEAMGSVTERASSTIDVSTLMQNVQSPWNEQLPISANYNYWSANHAKSIEVKQYVRDLHKEEKRIKQQLRAKKRQISQQKRLKQQAELQQMKQQEQRQKEENRQAMLKKIEEIKQQGRAREERQRKYAEFLKQQKLTKPLFERMQDRYKQTIELPLLEERKMKLQQLRNIKKPSLEQIQEHARKHDQKMNQSRQHTPHPSTSTPIKVSYRSKFHSQLNASISNTDQLQKLYERKKQYGKRVVEQFKPEVNDKLAKQIQYRIELDNNPKALLYRKQLKPPGEGEESQQSQEENEDEDDEEGDQQEQEELNPHKYRVQLGNEYLAYMRGLKKRSKQQIQKQKEQKVLKEKELEEQKKRKAKKIDYLHDARTRSHSASGPGHLLDWKEDLKKQDLDEISKKKRILMKSERIAQKASRREVELAHQKLNQTQLLQQRQKVDQQYLESIKAKIALMQV